MSVALYSRVLQFTAGPNATTFHACEEHVHLLSNANGHANVMLFFSTSNDPLLNVDPDDEEECYFCREGG